MSRYGSMKVTVDTSRFADCVPHDASRTSIQSSAPSAFAPGVTTEILPLFANGLPSIALNVPFVGSYQRAVTEPAKPLSDTVSVADPGHRPSRVSRQVYSQR